MRTTPGILVLGETDWTLREDITATKVRRDVLAVVQHAHKRRDPLSKKHPRYRLLWPESIGASNKNRGDDEVKNVRRMRRIEEVSVSEDEGEG